MSIRSRLSAVASGCLRTIPLLMLASVDALAQEADWEHGRIAATVNFSHDPSHYDGPRSSYFLTSWTASDGTLLQFRVYLDNFVPHEVDDTDLEARFVAKEAVKEIFLRHKFANGLEWTAGDIRATAHSDNNKMLYSGDGKPLHSTVVEIDRVLGTSAAKTWPVARLELTVADRGRKDLRWDGMMEAIRVSRAFHDSLRDVQVTFVNRTGHDAGGVAAARQWQAGVGGSFTTRDKMNTFTGEYVHANFLPGRSLSTDGFSVAFERKLIESRAVSLVIDYEHIDGSTGVRFYEAGGGANVIRFGTHNYVRLEGGWRRNNARAVGRPTQNGAFVRMGLTFDRGKGSVKVPPTILNAPPN
jgi:hypothetical protein